MQKDADLLFEHYENDAVQIRYLYGPGIDHILESVDGDGTKQHFADALGSVAKITDNAGDDVKSMTYDSFGNIVDASGSASADHVRFIALAVPPLAGFPARSMRREWVPDAAEKAS